MLYSLTTRSLFYYNKTLGEAGRTEWGVVMGIFTKWDRRRLTAATGGQGYDITQWCDSLYIFTACFYIKEENVMM